MQDSEDVATAMLEYGNGVWWNSARMIKDLRRVIVLRKRKFPWARVIWRFDHSSNHTAKAVDALNVHAMNLGPGGSKPAMRDTTVVDEGSFLKGKLQKMVWVDGDRFYAKGGVDGGGCDPTGTAVPSTLWGKPKGLVRVLRERWGPELGESFTGKQRAKGLRDRLNADLDFQLQTTLIHDLIAEECPDDVVRFYPKFHCEFPAIERFWSAHKRYCRENCRYNIVGLRKIVPQGLDAVCSDSVRRYFALCRRWEAAYRKDIDVSELEKVVKVYTSHRRVVDKGSLVEKLIKEGKLQEEEFKDLCICSDCSPDHQQICVQPRCPKHGIEALGGRRLTDSDVPSMGYPEKPSKTKTIVRERNDMEVEDVVEQVVGEEKDVDQGDPEEGVEVEDSDGDFEDDGVTMEVACTKKECRRWRQVERRWWAAQQTVRPATPYRFVCNNATRVGEGPLVRRRCNGKCDHCWELDCVCVCDECSMKGKLCSCPDSNDTSWHANE